VFTLLLLFPSKIHAVSNWTIESGINYINIGDEYGEVWVSNSAELNVIDGNIGRINCNNTSTTNIYGWSNSDPIPSSNSLHIVANDYSVVNIFQGNTNGQLSAYSDSTVNIYGSDFNFGNSYLTGTWVDGTDFSFYMRGYFQLPNQIILHEVPEPATLALFSIGALLIRRKK
jgi:hypothetical protein